MADSQAMSNADTPQRLLTPSKVTAWLECAHYLTLRHAADAGHIDVTNGGMGEFAQLLMDKGLDHEHACLVDYADRTDDVFEVPDWDRPNESFQAWVDRVSGVLHVGHAVVYQMPFVHDGMRGIADFLVKHTFDDGSFTYEPVDAKLARREAKPGHVLQLCFYADAIQAAGLAMPEQVHVWLGSGRVESIRLREVHAYWSRMRTQLKVALADLPGAATTAVKCNHCSFCEFAGRCEAEWRDRDALQFVAGIRKTETNKLETDGVTTLAALAERATEVQGVRPERRLRLRSQAALQVKARQLPEGSAPPSTPLADPTSEEQLAGLAALPAPDEGDVFLDYEGHPFWQAETGLFFLFGLLTKSGDTWRYGAWWAHSKVEEGERAAQLIEHLAARRATFPGMHVYHYNHTERSQLEAMAAEHGADQSLLDELVQSGLFIDLLPIVRNSLQAGVESYGLKSMERLAGYERSHDIDKGAGAVVEYEQYMKAPDAAVLDRIATYNEDDVRATLALRDWLIAQRDADQPWRPANIAHEVDEHRAELDELVAHLHQSAPGTPEHLMGDLLGYWGREGRVNTVQLLAKLQREPPDLIDDQFTIGGLSDVHEVALKTKTGRSAKRGGMEFSFPGQPTAHGFAADGEFKPSVCYLGPDGLAGWADVIEFDLDAGRIVLQWNQRAIDLGVVPHALALNEWIDPRQKRPALRKLGEDVRDGLAGLTVEWEILKAAPPRFAGAGPRNGRFSDEIDEVMRWVVELDRSCVAVQGPPGTGKTWMGAHLALALRRAGKRVGITATSHHAIDNLLREAIEVFEANGEIGLLNAVRKGRKDGTPDHPQVTIVDSNPKAADPKHGLVAGTTWLFASKDVRDNPVDVLLIDEAGQLGLADALAACGATASVVLFGDPLQLPQVSQASHPGRSGVSVLEHLLGEGVATVPPDRGVFLTTTRRMHPDVCRFISDEIYESRLGWHESCARQSTAVGTGLRWLRADHTDRVTESAEEAELVAEAIYQLLGRDWVDSDGTLRALTTADVLVVAPYNDQVRLMRRVFDSNPLLAGTKVGTVDKFQGQQAPVVFFTMTSSSADDMPRGPEFLFSRNRLNVAISRAKCLAYVVCTEQLLNSRAKSIEDMKLISTLCSAVAYAQQGP